MAMPTSGAVPVARSEPRTRTALLLEAIALRHQIAMLERSELVARVFGVLIGCFATVSRYLPAPSRGLPSWPTFFRNQASAFGQYTEERSKVYAGLQGSPIGPSSWDPRLRRLLR